MPIPTEHQRLVYTQSGRVPLSEIVAGGAADGAEPLLECNEHYQLIHAPPDRDYELRYELGSGAFATVVRGNKRRSSSELTAHTARRRRSSVGRRTSVYEPPDPNDRAIKTMDLTKKPQYRERLLAQLALEVKTLRRVTEHPNICSVYDCYFFEDRFSMVLDLCTGGELFDRIEFKKQYTEADAKFALAQIAEAIGHCHVHEVVHRDLKPENVLYVAPEGQPDGDLLKICDFGLAVIAHGHDLRRKVGTPGYDAPEVLDASAEFRYGTEVDMWSLGCVLYVMLAGHLPFFGDTPAEVRRRTRKADYSLSSSAWFHVSKSAKRLVQSLLMVDAAKRATAQDVVSSEWLSSDQRAHAVHLEHFAINVKRTKLLRKFRAAVDAVIAANRLNSGKTPVSVMKTPGDFLNKSATKSENHFDESIKFGSLDMVETLPTTAPIATVA